MMGIEPVWSGYALEQFSFNDQWCGAKRQAGSIGNSKDMCINGHRGPAKSGVQYDIGCFTSDAS